MKNLKQTLQLLLAECEDDDSEKIIFTDYIEHWIEKRANDKKKPIRANTLASYKQINRLYIIPYFTKNPVYLEDMTVQDINKFYDDLLDRVSVNTVKHVKVNMTNIFKLAIKENLVMYNPALSTEDLPPEKNSKEVFIPRSNYSN